MIKTVAFDLGGVIMTIDNDEPKRRLREIGATDADKLLDPYVQSGYFGDLENGFISEEDFRLKLSEHVGRELTWDDCQYVWLGYVKDVPRYALDALVKIREMGYRLVLASNTNGFMQAWADSERFSGYGHGLSHYFDHLYRSYEIKEMKPDAGFFRYILREERIQAGEILYVDDGPRNCASAAELGFQTFCPENGIDWTAQVMHLLEADRSKE